MAKKAHDYRDLSVEDLEAIEREKSEELMNMRMRLKMHQIDNPLSVRTARRELATIKTVIQEKRQAAAR